MVENLRLSAPSGSLRASCRAVLVAVSILIQTDGFADVTAELDPKLSYLSVVAVGPVAKASYQGVTLATRKPGETPPSVLLAESLTEGKKVRIRVGNNRFAPFVRVPAARKLKLMRKLLPQYAKTKFYFELSPLSAGKRHLLILRPNGMQPLIWKGEPRWTLFDLDGKGMKGRDLLLLNLTREHKRVKIGRKSILLKASSKVALTINNPGHQNLRVYSGFKPDQLMLKTTLSLIPKQFHLVVIYDAEASTNRGKSLGIVRSTIPRPHKIRVNAQGEEVSPSGFETAPAPKERN